MDIEDFQDVHLKIKLYPADMIEASHVTGAFYEIDIYDNHVGESRFVCDETKFCRGRSLSKREISLIFNKLKKIRIPTDLKSGSNLFIWPISHNKIVITFHECRLIYQWSETDLINFKSIYSSIHALANIILELVPNFIVKLPPDTS